MEHFYDGQVRRYVTQMVRLMSNFSVKDGKGNLTQIPVTYGDLTRQVANIIRDNSENKIPSAPRIAVHITGMEIDRERTSDASYISKVNIRERAYDETGKEYLNYEGKNCDIWSTNTDMKLQILEQILVLFNPSLELQTTDNYIDWTSLTAVMLDSVTWSSRSVPVGVDSEIDVSTLTFSTPIYISPPVKVKRLGVITNIITSIFDEDTGTIDLGLSMPTLNSYDDSVVPGAVDTKGGRRVETTAAKHVVGTNYQDYGVYIQGTLAQIESRGIVGASNWRQILDSHPGQYQDGISRMYFTKLNEVKHEVTGTISMNPIDETQLIIDWDTDTFPSNSIIEGPVRNNNQWTTIDYIIDPQKTVPTNVMKGLGGRLLLLNDIGDASNGEGANAWRGDLGDLVAKRNDIIEWNGTSFVVVFEAVTKKTVTYVTNLNTGIQYRWDGEEWLLSVEGLYPGGTWRIALNG
jgi:hypothetical protein